MIFQLHIRLFFLLLGLASLQAQALDLSQFERAPFSQSEIVGHLAHPKLTETSGLMRSGYHDDLYWGINDGGNGPWLYAIDAQGNDLGRYKITGAVNRDWEDISQVTHNGKSYLVIGDIGDNRARYQQYTLYFVEEPSQLPSKTEKPQQLDVAWRLLYTYEDGARDAESFAVDAVNKTILIASKRETPAALYQLPLLFAAPTEPLVAKRVAVFSNIPQPDITYLIMQPIIGLFASQPTAMDISPDGLSLVLLTYRYAYLYNRTAQQQWSEVVSADPQVIYFPALIQAESITFDRAGESLLVTSEYRSAPLVKISRKADLVNNGLNNKKSDNLELDNNKEKDTLNSAKD